jgi:dienelactone hydrolase
MTESFPRQQARTRHFTLGLPRSFQISPAGDRVAFLRSRGGDDPVNCLWVLDVATGAERLAADPAALGGGMAPTEQENARRERVREQATGIVSFACDSALTLAAFVLAGPILEDQVAALAAAADRCADLDTGRVGIRGWSFGGYLAALAVLRRPDVFHAAVAGAPVTDWRLYDTHYTERYLGQPGENGIAYDNCSLLGDAPKLQRPLLLIHGLADDNLVAAHTLRLSAACSRPGGRTACCRCPGSPT